MNSIASSERIKVYHGNFISASSFSMQQTISAESDIVKAEEYLRDNSFFKKIRVGYVKFVDDRVIHNLFRSSRYDVDSVYNAVQTIAAKIPNYRTKIVDRYDATKKTINVLSSSVDSAAIYQNRYFSNMFVITELFDTENDIIKDSSPLFVDTYEQKLTLLPSKVEAINLSNASVAVSGTGTPEALSSANNIIDASPSTFFDYRQSSGEENVTADISILLSESQIINQIVVDVNNYGAQLPLILEDVLISEDGATYSSISDQSNFLNKYLTDEDSSSRFILDTLANNGSSLFTIDFVPVSVKSIRFKFKQDQLHPGENQYLIGINNISLRRAYFNGSGSVIIKKAVDTSRIRSLALDVKSYTNLSVFPVQYQISLDGSTWNDIQPINAAGSKSEILYFNQPWIPSSIVQSGNSGYVYVKVTMNKNLVTDNLISMNQSDRTDERPMPTLSSMSFKTDRAPIVGSSAVEISSFIGMGIKDHNLIALGKTQPGKFLYSYKLPIGLKDDIYIQVDGCTVNKFLDKSIISTGQFIGYYIDEAANMIHVNVPNPDRVSDTFDEKWIANEVTGSLSEKDRTFIRSLLDSKDIEIFFAAEISSRPASRKILLDCITNGIKADVSIKKSVLEDNDDDRIISPIDFIAAGVTKVALSYTPIYNDTDYPIEVLGGAINGVEYKDGFSEFMGEHFSYSIDVPNKTLYLSAPLSKAVSIQYSAYDSYILSQNDFELVTEEDKHYVLIREEVYSKKAKFHTTYVANFKVPESLYQINNDTFTISSFESSIFDNKAYTNQRLLISYSYKDTLRYSISEIADLLTPSIDNLNIVYSI